MSDRGGGALTRDVILRISAQNLSTADFRAATAAVNELTAAVDKQIEAAAKGTVKEKELTEALSKLNDAGKSFTGFSRIIENLKGLDIQIAAQIKRVAEAKEAWDKQQAAVDANDNATKKELSRLAGLKTGHENAVKALNGQIERQKAYRDELEKNGLDAQNLANAERQLLAVVDQAGLAVNKLTQARDNCAKILRQTKEEELKNIQVQEAATKAAQERAAAEREVAHALEQAQQRMFARDREISRAEVGTGAQAHLAALAAERKAEQDRIAAERAAEIERGRIRQA